ncbi:MAG: hypothetical protein AAFN92_06435 [Bacteroidota bacterium]
MMDKTVLMVVLCTFLSLLAHGQKKEFDQLIKFQDKIQGLDTTDLLEHRDTVVKFLKVFKAVRDYALENRDLSGKVNFGFNGNQSSANNPFNDNNRSVYNIIGGLKLTRGVFPTQLEVSTQLNVSVVDGELQENLSNLNISYDRHFSKDHNLGLESYAFFNRRTDRFLGVSQRYEIGGGLIMASWSDKFAVDTVQERYDALDNKFKNISVKEGVLVSCLNDCIKLADKISQDEVDLIVESQNKIKNSIVKQNTPLRLGLLIGGFIEMENTMFSDSLETKDGKVFRAIDFTPALSFRWEVRPTIDFRVAQDAVFVKIRPYFKFPMPWNWTQKVRGKEVFNFRMDFPIEVAIKVTKDFEVALSHTFFYDNTPSSMLVDDLLGPVDDEPVFAVLNKLHQFSVFQVAFTL